MDLHDLVVDSQHTRIVDDLCLSIIDVTVIREAGGRSIR